MDEILVDLLERNAGHARAFDDRFDDLQHAQHPAAVTVCCSDSRVLQDHMWGNDDPGRIFTCGNIGNRVTQWSPDGETVSGDVLYPIVHTATELAVVVGHTGCGAVTATYDAITTDGLSEPPGIEAAIELLRPHVGAGVDRLPDDVDRGAAIEHLVEYNVDCQVQALRASEDVPDAVTVAGAVYDFQNVYGGPRGQVALINVDGERDVETLRADAPARFRDRVERVWEY